MEEVWKDINGYEGLYQVSNLGRVKSLMFINNVAKKHREKILFMSTRSGYYTVNLCKDTKRVSKQVHRLVAEAFIPNPLNKKVVNHIDFNRKNNIVTNLEWNTQKENVLWSNVRMRKHRLKPMTNTNERYIIYRKSNNTYRVIVDRKEYKSQKTLQDAIILRDKILKEKNIA